MNFRILLFLPLLILLSACGSGPKRPLPQPESNGVASVSENVPSSSRILQRPVVKRGGGYYQDDGPLDETPDNLDDIPDAQPKLEPLHKPAMRPYVVLGKQYVPHTQLKPYKARGIASWYGKKFHGKKTSVGESYDMFAMTAAHTILAIPSYVRVTNPRNGKSVVVRVNDRGPFHAGRIIDLSYTAAYKLDIINNGSSEVEIEAILPGGEMPLPVVTASPSEVPTRPSSASRSEARDELADLIERVAEEENKPQKGIFLQLGAFARSDNAENLKLHLASELDWLRVPFLIQFHGGIHRLQVGPFANRDEALRVAERIRQALGAKPALVVR